MKDIAFVKRFVSIRVHSRVPQCRLSLALPALALWPYRSRIRPLPPHFLLKCRPVKPLAGAWLGRVGSVFLSMTGGLYASNCENSGHNVRAAQPKLDPLRVQANRRSHRLDPSGKLLATELECP
jgi:hypothetical protein